MRAQAIVIDRFGGPEVLVLREADLPAPGPGEARVRQSACGVNYLDVYQRSGAYPAALPAGAGNEAAGVVEAVGPDVERIAPGDRVAYQGGAPGAYASHRILPADRLVRLPTGVPEEAAAACLLKGMTVEYLFDRCARLAPGDFALIYAAAGGVGLLAGQWARRRGIRLIGVASGPDKCALALRHGYHAVIDRQLEPIAPRAREIAGGGLPAVFDAIGRATFETSLDCLAPLGLFVSFGATSGPPPPVEAATLQKRGSLFFTRPTLATYAGTPELYAASAAKVTQALAAGELVPCVGQRYPLADAARAHRDLEAGRTTGASLLLP